MHELRLHLPVRPRGVTLLPAGASWPALTPLPPPGTSPADILQQIRSETRLTEQLVANLADAIRAVEERRRAEADRWRGAAVELALAVSARLLRRAIDADEFPVEAMVAEMAARFDAGASLTAFLHPADIAALDGRFGDSLRLEADISLPRGDARVEDGSRVVVSQLADQFASLRDEILRSPAS